MQRISYREYRVRVAWMEQQYQYSTPDQYYFMRICHYLFCLVAAFTGKEPQGNTNDFKIKVSKTIQKPMTREQAALTAKNRWLGLVKGRRKK